MGNEMSKATQRRRMDWRYSNRWFVGTGLDVGCGYDPLNNGTALQNGFTKMVSCTGYDKVLGSGDAQVLSDVADGTYDFVVSSHCLEHMRNPAEALKNWLRVVCSGGFVIVTIPDYDLYEHRHWPSKFNGDHKWSWTLSGDCRTVRPAHVIYLPEWLVEMSNATGYTFDIEMMQLLTKNYNYDFGNLTDQTADHLDTECAIEFVLRKC